MGLSEEQRKILKETTSIPDADAVLVFTAQLDASQHRKGRSIATRLHPVLQSVRDFSAIIDTFVSSNPGVAAVIWGSVKLTIQVIYYKYLVKGTRRLTKSESSKIAINFASYYEAFSKLFMGFASHCPRFSMYQALYPSSVRLQKALCDFHASIIRCCKHAVQVAQRTCLSLCYFEQVSAISD